MSSNQMEFFTKDDGQELPFSNEKYLFPFMMPTSKGTHYRNGPPAGDLMDHQKGRILLQVHQLLHLLQEYRINLKGKRLLDVGTGNGMIPQLILDLSDLESAVGSDPYLDGETVVSWQVHDHDQAFQDLRSFLHTYCPDTFDYNAYQHLLEHENYTMIPQRVSLAERRQKQYRFAKVGAHDLPTLGEKFDVVYAKAVEHISDWDGMFQSLAAATNEGAVLYFKHRTFFSYLGAHRRGSIGMPWGHLLLNDEEYKRCVTQFYPDDAQKMIEFYFNGLTYPRATVPEMIQIARKHQFCPVVVISEPTRHIDRLSPLINDVDNFWEIVRENHPCAGADEILAGMYHILLRKI